MCLSRDSNLAFFKNTNNFPSQAKAPPIGIFSEIELPEHTFVSTYQLVLIAIPASDLGDLGNLQLLRRGIASIPSILDISRQFRKYVTDYI